MQAEKVMSQCCLPLVGEQQATFEKHLEEMDVSSM